MALAQEHVPDAIVLGLDRRRRTLLGRSSTTRAPATCRCSRVGDEAERHDGAASPARPASSRAPDADALADALRASCASSAVARDAKRVLVVEDDDAERDERRAR